MRWGISTTLCKDESVFDCLDDIDNFFGIELRLRQPHFDYEDKEEIKKLKSNLKKRDIEPISVHMPDKGVNIAAEDEWKRMFSVREVEKGILIASRLGAKSIVVHPGGKREESEIGASLKSLAEIVNFSKEWGVKILIENTFPGDLGDNINDFGDIISKSHLPVCLDTSHSYSSGDASDIIKNYRDKIVHLHISDNLMKGNDDHLLPGEGKIDWVAFWKEMNDFQGSAIFELMPALNIKKRISAIKGVIKEWEKEYLSSS